MNSITLGAFLAGLPGYGFLQVIIQEFRYKQWQKRGCPMPPPHKVKQQILKRAAGESGLTTLVETGTLFGDMIHAMRHTFSEIYSIELSESLYQKAVRRFKGSHHIQILNGDSGEVLHELAPKLSAPTLFWLDGHYSGEGTALGAEETPIFKELDAVLNLTIPFGIAIDDARLFGTDPAYPSKEELIQYVQSKNASLSVKTESDIILVAPEGSAISTD